MVYPNVDQFLGLEGVQFRLREDQLLLVLVVLPVQDDELLLPRIQFLSQGANSLNVHRCLTRLPPGDLHFILLKSHDGSQPLILAR